jgi:hypothetical protein
MASRAARLLCTGREPELLTTRCAVLKAAGYDAQASTLWEGEALLRTVEEFDLIIFSAGLSESERGGILSAAGETPTYVLQELVHPAELLAQVDRLLAPAEQQKRLR